MKTVCNKIKIDFNSTSTFLRKWKFNFQLINVLTSPSQFTGTTEAFESTFQKKEMIFVKNLMKRTLVISSALIDLINSVITNHKEKCLRKVKEESKKLLIQGNITFQIDFQPEFNYISYICKLGNFIFFIFFCFFWVSLIYSICYFHNVFKSSFNSRRL